MPQNLAMVCQRCQLSNKCPEKGSSPLRINKREVKMCNIIGGYSQEPINPNKLSARSRRLAKENGPCLSIVEVPKIDKSSGLVYEQTTKVFHELFVHPRQKVQNTYRMYHPVSK